MDYSDQRLQFLDLTDATENDQSFIEQILFSSNQALEVPWSTGASHLVENLLEPEWNSAYSIPDADNENDQSRREESGRSSQNQCTEGSSSEELPRPGGIFPGHTPTSLPHQAQPMFQMYQMVPSLSNVYVSNVTANVNVHAPYVPPMPTHYSHQIPPQQQPPSQPMYPHSPSDGDQGNRNRRQRQKSEKKRDGPFTPSSEMISPPLESHPPPPPPPQFPGIHPMQPYYISGGPGAPVYMQHAVLPVYPSAMFNPYGHSPGPIVYPPTNSMDSNNEEYHESVQQNFHHNAPEMVVVNCPVQPENPSERSGIENNEIHYQAEEQRLLLQQPLGSKSVSDSGKSNSEKVDIQPEQPAVPQNCEDSLNKAREKEEGLLQKEEKLEMKFENQNGEKTCLPETRNNNSSFFREICGVKIPNKANGKVDVNIVNNVSVNGSSGAGAWSEEAEKHVASPTEDNKIITKSSNIAQVMTAANAKENPVPVSQNNDFPLIGQSVKSYSRAQTSFTSPEPERHPTSNAAQFSGGKSWASLFNRSDPFGGAPMSDNRGRPLARVLPYHESGSAPLAEVPSMQSPKDPKLGKPTPANTNGPISQEAVSSAAFSKDPQLYTLGVFLCNYELDHKIVSLQPRGLTNRSNWCYVNAILQSLIACPPFYNLLKALPFNKKGSKQTLIMDAMVEYVNEFSLLPATSRIGKREKSARNKEENSCVEILAGPAFEPSCIYKILDKVRGESSFNVEGRQEDAEEFLSCLLNGLNDEMFELMKMVDSNKLSLSNGEANGLLEGTSEDDDSEWNVMGPKNKSSVTRRAVCGRTPVADIFRGQFRSRVQRAGDQSTDTVQPFFTLQLDIEKASSVRDALELFMGRDPLEGVTCSRTHQEIEAWTQTTLEDLPLVLILHLKCYDYKSDACSKILKNVEFQVDLKIDSKLLSNRNKYTGKQRNYKLVAVVYHDGKEASKGHYVTDAYHVGYGCWLRYDDVVVRSVPESHVLKPRAPRVPYLLYYRRADTIGPSK